MENFDHWSPEWSGDRVYPVYEAMRSCPVQHVNSHGGYWALTRYQDVTDAAMDWQRFSSANGVVIPMPPDTPKQAALEYDPPEHKPHRKIFMRMLSRQRVREAQPWIDKRVRFHLDSLADQGELDFVSEFAVRLPVEVIGHILGLGDEMCSRIRELTEVAWSTFKTDPNAFAPLIGKLLTEVAERRAEPRDDFVTWINKPEPDGPGLTDQEIAVILLGAILAGHETTMVALENLVLDLLQHPDLVRRLREDPALIPGTVEESLRYRAPAQRLFRTATGDMELHGTKISAGDRVMLTWGAANRDPDRFDQPETFDPERPSNQHLSFGWGIHRCAGEHLAQAELRSFLSQVIEYELMSAGEPVFAAPEGGSFLGVEKLPIRVAKRPASAGIANQSLGETV